MEKTCLLLSLCVWLVRSDVFAYRRERFVGDGLLRLNQKSSAETLFGGLALFARREALGKPAFSQSLLVCKRDEEQWMDLRRGGCFKDGG